MKTWKDFGTFSTFEWLYEFIAMGLPDNAVCAEVGVLQGYSVFHLVHCARRLGKRITVHAIDWFEPEKVCRKPEDPVGVDFPTFVQSVKDCDASLEVFPHRITSVEGAALFPDRSFDFVFLDADHSYEAVRADLQAWLPKVKVGGILAGHDYADPVFPGVMQAIAELLPAAQTRGTLGVWWLVPEALVCP